MITSLNPKINLFISIASIVVFFYLITKNVDHIFFFFIGMLSVYPVVNYTWRKIQENWEKIYKKFYSKKFHQRDIKIIKKSWKLTWLLIPYCVLIYSIITVLTINFFGTAFLLSIFLGSLTEITWFLQRHSKKYYKKIGGKK